MSTFKNKMNAVPLEVREVEGKMVIIRVEDPQSYQAGDYLTKLLKKAGAALVIIAKPSDVIEFWDDEMLKHHGLHRIEHEAPKPCA